MATFIGRFRASDHGGISRRLDNKHDEFEREMFPNADPGKPGGDPVDDEERECKCGSEESGEACTCKPNDDEPTTKSERREKFMADYNLRNGITTNDAMARDWAKMSPTQRFIAASDRRRGRVYVARTTDGLPVSDIGLSPTARFIAASKRLRAR